MRDLIERGETFSLSRFGDGEFACMLGSGPANCDRHEHMPDLRWWLLRAAHAPIEGVTYSLMQPHISEIFGEAADKLLDAPAFHGIADCSAHDTFKRLSAEGEAQVMVDYLRGRKSAVMGPHWYRDLPFVVDQSCGFIEVPAMNCYAARPRLVEKMIRYIRKGWDTISMSASMASEALIHEVFTSQGVSPVNVGLIDVGALWDPYVGHFNRIYHSERTAEEWRSLIQ